MSAEERGWGVRIGRRRFLATLASGVAALVMQACGRREELPPRPIPTVGGGTETPLPPTTTTTALPPSMTPTGEAGSRTYLPLAANDQTPTPVPTHTAAPTATARPTETLAPTETAAPTEVPPPTNTPVPPPTPFPPGPPSKLGLFVGYNHPQLFELLSTGNVALVKTLEFDANFVAGIKAISPQTIIVARYGPLDQINLATVDPVDAARRFVDALLPIATEPLRLANIDAWEAYNEPVPATREEMARLATFEIERTRLLAAAGVRSCVGNFGTGQPELNFWPDFLPAVAEAKAHNGYLGLHEYSAPYMWYGSGSYQAVAGNDEGDEGWLTLRYRKVYRQYLQPAGLELPLVITETGVDGAVANRPGPTGLGWRDFQEFWRNEGRVRSSPDGFYVEQLAWYDAELIQDPYVKGAAIFAMAAPPGWESFELIGEVGRILQRYLAVHPRRG